jgi:hypothetical protein
VSPPQPSRLRWYARRASRMSPVEMAWRGRDAMLQVIWSGRQVRREQTTAEVKTLPGERPFTAVLGADTAARVPADARAAVLTAAAELMAGRWEMLGTVRRDMLAPDWFHDPVTGHQAPADRYSFRINHRSEADTGNVKQLWELSRLQHLTLLATAWFLTHDDKYACRTADQLSGVHWTSGIEVGLRLISMTWIRRLLDDWPHAADLFEHNELAVQQICWHQSYLAAFRSRGSSANNHVIAEAAGQLVASCAFPWFAASGRWRQAAARLLERALGRNTFPSGIGRELATDYQCFVAELGILAAVEAAAAGYPVSATAWQRLCAMLDSGAALLDEQLRPPRQGDGDEGRAVLLDASTTDRWAALLALGAELFGRPDWWPPAAAGAASTLIGALHGGARSAADRPHRRPWHFPDAGTTILRTSSGRGAEIWCRCDGGPHGFSAIAAHAHADALSIEVRCGGVTVLADPGTYCYHGEPEWRSYFRSTIAHNTIEVARHNQSLDGGPFLWLRHANGREISVQDFGDVAEWFAEHNGYLSLAPPVLHRRCVRLDRASQSLDIVDEVIGGCHDVRLAFHLGPAVSAELAGTCALLHWQASEARVQARLELPNSLRWSAHRGEVDPILGWYSEGLGRRVPTVTLLGCGRPEPHEPLSTRLEFLGTVHAAQRSGVVAAHAGVRVALPHADA